MLKNNIVHALLIATSASSSGESKESENVISTELLE